jgi:hypothetical protein
MLFKESHEPEQIDLNEFMASIVNYDAHPFDIPSPASMDLSPTFMPASPPDYLFESVEQAMHEQAMHGNIQESIQNSIQPLFEESPLFEVNQVQELLQEKELTASQKKAIRESKRNLVCHNCQTQKTCLWRKSLDKKHHLCNPCSLYERQHKKPRPVDYKNRPARKARETLQVGKKSQYVTLHWSQLQALLDMAAQSRFRRS